MSTSITYFLNILDMSMPIIPLPVHMSAIFINFLSFKYLKDSSVSMYVEYDISGLNTFGSIMKLYLYILILITFLDISM